MLETLWDSEEKKRQQTEEQALADELCKFYKEPKRFGFWCGIIKKFGRKYVDYRFRQMVDSVDPTSPRYFIYELKKYEKPK